MTSSNTVPSGSVISESPSSGTIVPVGSAVNLVISSGSPTLVSISVTPASPTIAVGGTQQFTATGTYSDGSNQNLTSAATWASGTTTVATINNSGLATGVTAGTSNITASVGGVTSPNDVLTVSHASATYAGLDTTTEGTWTGKYGTDGYVIPNDATNLPGYATMSVTGATAYSWAGTTSDVRALQTAGGATTRIASAYYAGNSFTINVNLTDGKTHKMALYLLDWDSTTRAETITIKDAVSGTVLDTESYSSFHNGEYGAWNIKGNVIIQVTRTGSANAVVNGIFFGLPPSSSASYSGLDTTTEGTWTGKYGTDGYVIPNDATNLPGYATMSVTGSDGVQLGWHHQ